MRKAALVFLVVVLVATALPAAAGSRARASADPSIISWQPPARHSVAPAGGRSTLAEIGGGPVPFFPVTPCRQYDTRTTTALANNTPRTIALDGVPCGIPSTTNAVAVNITVFNITGALGNGVFKVDTVSPPNIAWINYPPTETQRANAGVVAVTSGALVVQVNQGAGSVDFVVDVFGYYYNGNTSDMPAGDTFEIRGDKAGNGVIRGGNTEAAAPNSHGVFGATLSAGTGSAGVAGQASASTGAVYGVSGSASSTHPDAAGVFGFAPAGAGVRGQIGDTATAGSAGVYGIGGATTEKTFGVLGHSSSASVDSAGVKGSDNSVTGGGPVGFLQAGVRGESVTHVGVLGFSDNIAVAGVLTNSTGADIVYGFLGSAFGVDADLTTGPWGVFAAGNLGASGAKHFVEPHPADPSKVIVYSSLEGREVGTYFRGTARASGGTALIEVPEDFGMVTDEEGLTVQLTPVGGWAQMYVESQGLNQIVIRSSRDVTFHYLVQGVRRAFKGFAPVGKGYEFMPRSADIRMPAYLTKEAKRRLIANGTYNSDGTVNMGTAERLGWAQKWRENEKARLQGAAKTSRPAMPEARDEK